MSPSLRSARLHYAPLSEEDFDALHDIMSDWSVVRQLGSWPWPPEPDFTRLRCRPYRGTGFIYGVRLDGVLIGTNGVTDGEIGYCFGRDWWGQGFATESSRVVIEQAFNTGLTSIAAKVWDDNASSYRLLTKLGFRETHRFSEMSKARGIETGSIALVLDRADYA
ncbi:GNAT family N-acetyltransferase [Pelagovum pacificum]|uniref:GNAT family N-acetyltransferase n=1 Tax=Pelagovum pacificum TaxID=2588711 RepID=UPI0018CE4B76|nr:GNAT family N-acetyltransferase [Pelagovum pacificum]QQA44518.1 GNAT family N-acetyltransferase [Pelagovum pacificum]